MNSMAELYLERAENELVAAGMMMEVSGNQQLQKEQFKIERSLTFYNAVINHAYYCIFYSAKAILINEGIRQTRRTYIRKPLRHLKLSLSKPESLMFNCS